VRDALPDPPTRTAVRTLLTILEQKGHLTHIQRGREYIFRPTKPRKQAAQSAIERVLNTFFEGSLPDAVALHLANPKTEVSDEELKLLARLIRDARQREK
jgi:predicted transcriptional regulator